MRPFSRLAVYGILTQKRDPGFESLAAGRFSEDAGRQKVATIL
jgi:hypothetical protein